MIEPKKNSTKSHIWNSTHETVQEKLILLKQSHIKSGSIQDEDALYYAIHRALGVTHGKGGIHLTDTFNALCGEGAPTGKIFDKMKEHMEKFNVVLSAVTEIAEERGKGSSNIKKVS